MLPANVPAEPPQSTTPRVDDLLAWVLDSLTETRCAVKRRELEAVATSLRQHQRFPDLTDEGERNLVVRIVKIRNQPDGPAEQEQDEATA